MPGGWADSDRRNTLPVDWATKVRPRILRRDGHRCTWIENGKRCPQRATDVDHVGDPLDHSDANLRALCGTHHDRRSSAQGNAAKAARRAARLRPPEPHPGAAP